jgi:hypothetical protein
VTEDHCAVHMPRMTALMFPSPLPPVYNRAMRFRKPTPAGWVLATSVFCVLLAAFPEQFVLAAEYLFIAAVFASPIIVAGLIAFVIRRINRRDEPRRCKPPPK